MSSRRIANSFTRAEVVAFNEIIKHVDRSVETEVLCRSQAYTSIRRKFLAMATRLVALDSGAVEN